MNFKEDLKKLNIELNDKLSLSFEQYYKFLVEYNEHVNLTAITDYEGVFYKHFYDSLTLSLALEPNKQIKLVDVGAGAVDAASAFFSSLQPVNTNADAIAVIANKFFNFMFFPCCE